ncbi:unnamed protein product [Mytilus coruscus]|uniref:Ubiquitin-like protease family profile domain-containing protein n=1 Tax=Mytilus coruscus TaxID=42192 RepID=A0A6J8F322_MYTCO|nr:unnamed protein product [Mytilus coruscus]
MATRLKNAFNQTTIREYQVFVFISEADQHSCHSNRELNKWVIQEITRQVENGIQDTSVVKRLLEVYVEKDLSINEPRSNRWFYPTDKDIRNHIYLTVTSSSSDEDSSTGDKANPFLFVFQTSFQQRLLMKYGQEIVLLDSTYKTTKYKLPLFLLCVLTNEGYHVVASFVIGKETRSNIEEGLSIIKKWNPGWNPSFFMCDCDTREIGALETVFKVKSLLNNVDSYKDNCIPTLSGLPIRQKLSRKQKLVTHSKSVHTPLDSKEKSTNLQDQCTIAETSSENTLFSSMEHDIYPGINLDQYEIEVEKFWRQQHGTDSIIGRIGPHTISDTSIIQLKSLVSDDIIDCFLHLLAIRFSGVYHLTAIIFTAIFNRMEKVHGFLRGSERRIHSSHNVMMDIYFFSKFMQLRYQNQIDVEPPGQWSTVSVPHARQPNGDSCGVFVMKIAENFLSGRSVIFNMTKADIYNFSKRLSAFLIFQTGATNTILVEDSAENGATNTIMVEDSAEKVATKSTEQSQDSAHKPALKMRKCRRKKKNTEKQESPTQVEQASYTMRSSRKKKRPSSFIFPDITAGKHTYCVCQKKNDCELYWQCCVCLRWYHPLCIGKIEDEEPECFKSINCEMEDGRCQKEQKNYKHPYTGFPTRKFKPVDDESDLVFSQHKLIADNYLIYVALKEALIFIVCVKKHCTYAEAEKLCAESEVDVVNLLKKKHVK